MQEEGEKKDWMIFYDGRDESFMLLEVSGTNLIHAVEQKLVGFVLGKSYKFASWYYDCIVETYPYDIED